MPEMLGVAYPARVRQVRSISLALAIWLGISLSLRSLLAGSFVLLDLASLLVATAIVARLLRKKALLSAIFVALILDVALVNWLKFFVLDLEPTSWRLIYYDKTRMSEAIGVVFSYLDAICLSALLFSKRMPVGIPRNLGGGSTLLVSIFLLVFLAIYAVTDLTLVMRGKIAYAAAATGIPFIELYQIFLYYCIINYVRMMQIGLGRLTLLAYIAVAILLLLSGFRGAVFGALTLIAVLLILEKGIRLDRLAIYMAVTILVFNVIGIFRVGSDVGGSGERIQTAVSKFGSHEENIYFTLVATMNAPGEGRGSTYADTLCLLLPGISDFQCQRASITLGNALLPESVMESGVNMGGFILTEAIFNYGVGGGLMLSLLMFMAYQWIESISRRGRWGYMLALLLAAQAYTFIFYGSSNFAKMAVYGAVIIMSLSMLGRMRLSSSRFGMGGQ